MFYVYILKSKVDDKLYYGYTKDLRRRIEEHNSGKNKSTKGRYPLDLVYYEAYRNKSDAKYREKMLKLNGRALGQLKKRIQSSIED